MNTIRVIDAIDMHCAGEPGRVLPSAHLFVHGRTMADRFDYARSNLEWLRRLVLREPRGHPALCAALIVPPDHPDTDFGLIVMNGAGFSPMSGSNAICATTALLQSGAITATEPVTRIVIDTAVGPVRTEATVRDGGVEHVAVHAPSSFVADLDVMLDVPEIGRVTADVAFGGQFVVQVRARDLGIDITTSDPAQIARTGALIKIAAARQLKLEHPTNPSIDYVGLVMLYEDEPSTGVDCRNAVVIANPDPERPSTWTGALDRSPCGNGTCARLAVLHARGRIGVGDSFVNQGILGTTFTGSIRSTTRVAGYGAVDVVVAGRAWTVARSQLILDRDDPFPEGLAL